ncbi:hypothetical protein TeGR_g10372, partial [Tetraparma gracilis]
MSSQETSYLAPVSAAFLILSILLLPGVPPPPCLSRVLPSPLPSPAPGNPSPPSESSSLLRPPNSAAASYPPPAAYPSASRYRSSFHLLLLLSCLSRSASLAVEILFLHSTPYISAPPALLTFLRTFPALLFLLSYSLLALFFFAILSQL